MNSLKPHLLIILVGLSAQPAFSQVCNFASEKFQNRVQKKFKQNPVRLIETFTIASHKLFLQNIDSKKAAQNQNQILSNSFDVNRINQSLLKTLKTRSVTRYLMDWVRTQYWGNIDQLYYSKELSLKSFSKDILAPHELNITNTHPVMTKVTRLSSRKCNTAEKRTGLCPGTVYEAKVQFSPYISCRQDILEKSFQGKFLLSFKRNQGFKILDVELSGKRIVLSSLDFLISQKRKGLNSQALTTQLRYLSSNSGSFTLPGVTAHSNSFLAKYSQPAPRLPASL